MAFLRKRTNFDGGDADQNTGDALASSKNETNTSKSSDHDLNKSSEMQPVNPLEWLAVLYHFALSLFYLWLFYYVGTLAAGKEHIIDPDGAIPKYGGPFKYLTHIHQCLQLLFFIVQFLTDILPKSSLKSLLQNVCDFTFTSVVFPMALGIPLSFWSIYAIDRNLIYPESFDLVFPVFVNHFWHTTIAVWVIFDILLCSRRYPSMGIAASVTFVVSTAYQAWIVWVFVKTGFWVYPFLGVLPPYLMALFFSVNMFISFGLYLLGKAVAHSRWGQTVYNV